MRRILEKLLFPIALAVTLIVYWQGLSGGFLFDDYPNIVDNQDVQPKQLSLASLTRAAFSSPASEFKRPVASLSFALNYASAGLDPFWMKLTNLVIHLLNGVLIFVLAQMLLAIAYPEEARRRLRFMATVISASWMLLPINLTAVLYVVQRMESLANLFVLAGLIGYVVGRRRMLASQLLGTATGFRRSNWRSFAVCAVSVTLPTALGVLAKETAVMLPLYAALVEWALFSFQKSAIQKEPDADVEQSYDWRIGILFLATLVVPLLAGSIWILPNLLKPLAWATRDFTITTRLLSEARIVVDYIAWTILPTPYDLSFYHDNFAISSSLFSPPSTAFSIAALIGLIAITIWLRSRRPLIALGIALFLGCQLLTATVLPLELIYEHRNYFASFGVMLAIIPALIPLSQTEKRSSQFALARYTLLGGLLLLWTCETGLTAMDWESPLGLAQTLAVRAPDSPRAQYELGRTYIIYSNYDPTSPFTHLAYAPLERAAALPNSSILPEQALIFMNSRMKLPIEDAWWKSLNSKLKEHKPGVQDESSLGSLTTCVRDHQCDLPANRLTEAYLAALSHPNPSARLLSMYGDFAWNVLNDRPLGLRMAQETVAVSPNEPTYHITLGRMSAALGNYNEVKAQIGDLTRLNIGGRLDADIKSMHNLIPSK